MSETEFDVIVIGSGAGGGTMARALAPTGKRILILERGGFVPRERENWSTQAVFGDNRYGPNETWHFDGRPFTPTHPHYNVGGSTKFYGAALIRMRERDFEAVEHAGGVSPAWPITYTDMEPFYGQAEQWYYVHGQDGADPTDPPRSQPYPYPPLAHEPRIQQLSDDLAQLGLRPYPLQMGVKLGYEDGEPGPETVLGLFDGYPDPTESKADAHVCGVRPALRHENVSLATHSYVARLETGDAGRRVTAVVVRDREGGERRYRGDIIVVAAGAINSAALFLRSRSRRHPNGLANGSDLVGRHYMSNINASLIALSHEPNDAQFQKTLGLSDYYWGSEAWPHPMGLIQMLGKVDALSMQWSSPEPLLGMTHEEMARHSIDFWLQAEDLPDPENRVALGPNNQILFHYQANNLAAYEQLVAQLKSLLNHIGCHEHLMPVTHYLGKRHPFNLAHQMGTLRFGHDARTSVLDVWCRPHELDNVYVTDGSFFVSSSAVNPTLTIIANALRVADHIRRERL